MGLVSQGSAVGQSGVYRCFGLLGDDGGGVGQSGGLRLWKNWVDLPALDPSDPFNHRHSRQFWIPALDS
jgi:hypothetical protein